MKQLLKPISHFILRVFFRSFLAASNILVVAPYSIIFLTVFSDNQNVMNSLSRGIAFLVFKSDVNQLDGNDFEQAVATLFLGVGLVVETVNQLLGRKQLNMVAGVVAKVIVSGVGWLSWGIFQLVTVHSWLALAISPIIMVFSAIFIVIPNVYLWMFRTAIDSAIDSKPVDIQISGNNISFTPTDTTILNRGDTIAPMNAVDNSNSRVNDAKKSA